MVSITQEWIPAGRINRPGKTNPMQYITIHETGNTAAGADARAHASYLRNVNAKVSWHYTVDSRTTRARFMQATAQTGREMPGPSGSKSASMQTAILTRRCAMRRSSAAS